MVEDGVFFVVVVVMVSDWWWVWLGVVGCMWVWLALRGGADGGN